MEARWSSVCPIPACCSRLLDSVLWTCLLYVVIYQCWAWGLVLLIHFLFAFLAHQMFQIFVEFTCRHLYFCLGAFAFFSLFLCLLLLVFLFFIVLDLLYGTFESLGIASFLWRLLILVRFDLFHQVLNCLVWLDEDVLLLNIFKISLIHSSDIIPGQSLCFRSFLWFSKNSGVLWHRPTWWPIPDIVHIIFFGICQTFDFFPELFWPRKHYLFNLLLLFLCDCVTGNSLKFINWKCFFLRYFGIRFLVWFALCLDFLWRLGA